MTEHQHDIAIVGAGPAGSAAAYFLARGGLDVALIDKAAFPRDKTCGDGLSPRAVKELEEMGVLDKIAAKAFKCNSVKVRTPEAREYKLSIGGMPGIPEYMLVLPRYEFDNILVKHAVTAGAELMSNVMVRHIAQAPSGEIEIWREGKAEPLGCLAAIVATGANVKLLHESNHLRANLPVDLAARCYFDDVEGLDDSIFVFFDDVEWPGYGWVFPTSKTSANVGCIAFFDDPTPQGTRLRKLLLSHPLLTKMLRNARQVGPIKSYPLRTDYFARRSGDNRLLVAGEALGLVNPLTGEGIDYAIESGHIAANAILESWVQGKPSKQLARHYRAVLDGHFRNQFLFMSLIRRLYLPRQSIMRRWFRRVEANEYLQRVFLGICYGSTSPINAFMPKVLWKLFQP